MCIRDSSKVARIKIGDWLIEDVALTMSGGRLCLRWAADAWDGTLDSAAELLGVASELREVDADDMTMALYAVRGLASVRMDAEHALSLIHISRQTPAKAPAPRRPLRTGSRAGRGTLPNSRFPHSERLRDRL